MSNKSTYVFGGAPFDAPEKENFINMPPEESKQANIIIGEVILIYEVEPNTPEQDRLVSIAKRNEITEIPASKTVDKDEDRGDGR